MSNPLTVWFVSFVTVLTALGTVMAGGAFVAGVAMLSRGRRKMGFAVLAFGAVLAAILLWMHASAR